MSKKPKWAKNLSAKEMLHLAEGSSTGRATLHSLKANLEGQTASGIACWECRSIATKLGILI